jgi:hypothetical protein
MFVIPLPYLRIGIAFIAILVLMTVLMAVRGH